MLEELQTINKWVESGDKDYNTIHGINEQLFIVYPEIYAWVKNYCDTYHEPPSKTTLLGEFESFQAVDTSRENISYLKKRLKDQRLDISLRSLLLKASEMYNEDNVDPSSLLDFLRNEVAVTESETDPVEGVYDWVGDAEERLEHYVKLQQELSVSGLKLGFDTLDDILNGILRDDLLLITARINNGKSLLSNVISHRAWQQIVADSENNKCVLVVSTESPEMPVGFRLDTLQANFSNKQLSRGKLTNVEDYADYIANVKTKKNPLYIFTERAVGGRQIKMSDIEALVHQLKPALLVIDQLYDIDDDTGERDLRKRIVNNTRRIRALNINTNTPTVLVVQSGRESAKDMRKDGDATPELDQIQESDAPAQKATKVLAIRQIDEQTFKVSIKKNREGEKNKDVFLRADIDKGTWFEISEVERVF